MLNVLWIFINVLCVFLTMYHLYKLYKDLSRSNLEAVRVATLVTTMIAVQSPQHGNGGLRSGHGAGPEGDPLGPSQAPTGAMAPTSVNSRIGSYLAKLEREGIARVKMFTVITIAYLIFWGPLFLVTLFSYTDDYKTENPSTSHEVTLHVAFVHAFVNPTLFLVLHKGLRKATFDLLCCNFRSPRGSGYQANGHLNGNGHHNNGHHRIEVGGLVAPPPPIVDARGQIIEGVPHSNRTYMWVFPDMINTSFHSLIY